MSKKSLIEKRKLVREYAFTIGMCKGCLRKEIVKGTTQCLKCLEINRANAAKYRSMPGHCSRCGKKGLKPGEKYCGCYIIN